MASRKPRPRPATLAAVALGGVLGAAARVFLPWPGLLNEHWEVFDPTPVAVVNLLGAALLGLVSGYTSLRSWPEPLLKGVTTGFLGSFTSMSALAVVYVGLGLGQALFEATSGSTALLVAGVSTIVLGVFLCLTTLLTIATYRLGRRMARSRA